MLRSPVAVLCESRAIFCDDIDTFTTVPPPSFTFSQVKRGGMGCGASAPADADTAAPIAPAPAPTSSPATAAAVAAPSAPVAKQSSVVSLPDIVTSSPPSSPSSLPPIEPGRSLMKTQSKLSQEMNAVLNLEATLNPNP